MAWLPVGDDVYYANGWENGRLRQGQAHPWAGERYPGPDRLGRFGPPPVGHELAWHAGRIWIASGALVHFTEGAGLFDWVDALAGYLPPFVGRVRLLAAVTGGLYVGDEAGVSYVAGHDLCPGLPHAAHPGQPGPAAGRPPRGRGRRNP
jgi:hypothetical protein